MRGEEYFTTPHVRMGYYHGIQIRLLDCTYCERACEPYEAYMCHFETKKNGADEKLEEAREVLERRKEGKLAGGQQTNVEWEQVVEKQSFDREQANIFLTSLVDRSNMSIGSPTDDRHKQRQ